MSSTKSKKIQARDDLIFETFYHKSGKEFQCMYFDGMRFYLDDWGSKEWQPFPKRWYNEGLLITNTVVVEDQENENNQDDREGVINNPKRGRIPTYIFQENKQDDREGVINHPQRGRIPTYIFQRKHNIHCFYDHQQGQWLRLPIEWELHHEMVGKLVDQIEKALPNWGDKHDILALLRACNYDPEECMSTYILLEGDPWLKAPKTHQRIKAAKEKVETTENLRMQIKKQEESMKEERQTKVEAKKIDESVKEERQAKLETKKTDKSVKEERQSKLETKKTTQDDLIFETFYHKTGKEFQCMYLDGMRFYLDDWGSKEWQPFPKRWYNEGLLITNSVVKDQENENRRRQQQRQHQSGSSSGQRQEPGSQQQPSRGGDDREGVIIHPKRGRIPTYLFQRKHNIHCFYDHQKNQWLRLPIEWELHHELVGKLVDQVEKALPHWGDRHDILALLRTCNYDPDECMSTYLLLEGDPWLKAPKTHIEAKTMEEKDESIEKLRMQIKEPEESLKEERQARLEAKETLQEQEGHIRVFCRARKDDRGSMCLKFPSDSDIICIDENQQEQMFSFDKVFDVNSTQEQIFEETKAIILSCADGYNVCLIGFGQTDSGKTFTMMGPDSNPGINIRAMKELLDVCKERKETTTYTLKVSLIEIYNETIQDLLTSDAKALELRTAGNKVNIPNLKEVQICSLDDIKKTMTLGDKNRHVAATKMNYTSSRSHLILMLSVEGHDKVSGVISKGTLTLCDLAGSQCISRTEAEGQRLVEAAAINKSLSALGQVFTALRKSQLYVPYRNSKLTQILKPSLGEDAKACLIVNVSPDIKNHSETVMTLKFGSNAKQVAQG